MPLVNPKDSELYGYVFHGDTEWLKQLVGTILCGYSADYRYRVESAIGQRGVIRAWQGLDECQGSILDYPISLLCLDDVKIS